MLAAILTLPLQAESESVAAGLTQLTLKNGDVFVGILTNETPDALTLRVQRMVVLQTNVRKNVAGSEDVTIFHKNGTLYRGKFAALSNGDYFLNSRLYPEEVSFERQDIRNKKQTPLRRKTGMPAAEPPGYLIQWGNRWLFFNEHGGYSEESSEVHFSATAAPVAQTETPAKKESLAQMGIGAAGTVSQIRAILPAVYSGSLGLSLNLENFFRLKSRLLPAAAVEITGLYSTNRPYSLAGGYVTAGPQWSYDVNGHHYVIASIQAGINYLWVKDSTISQEHISPQIVARIAYGYRFGDYAILGGISFAYIYDNLTPLSSLGGNVGIGKFLIL